MTTQPLKYATSPVRINVRNGVPICPCCQIPMTEVGENQWQCPEGAAIWQGAGAKFAEMLDSAILTAPQPADNAHTDGAS